MNRLNEVAIIIVMLLPVFTSAVHATGTVYVDSCRTLDQAGTVYLLTQNITAAGTCFTITANNVTLDGNGKTITYSTNGNYYEYGVFVSGFDYASIENVVLVESGNSGAYDYAIYLDNSNEGIIRNNIITTSGIGSFGVFLETSPHSSVTGNNFSMYDEGIYLSSSPDSVVSSNQIETYGNYGYGVQLHLSQNSAVINNNITTSGNGSYGIFLEGNSNYNTLANNTILTTGDSSFGMYFMYVFGSDIEHNDVSSYGSWFGWGIFLEESDSNVFADNYINSAYAERVYFYNSNNNIFRDNVLTGITKDSVRLMLNSINNTFLNTSYSAEYVEQDSQLIRQWYLDVNATSAGAPLQNANVTAWNVTGRQVFSVLTDCNGRIPIQILTEYAITDTSGLKIFSSTPYTIVITKPGYTAAAINSSLNGNQFISIDMVESGTMQENIILNNGWNLISLPLSTASSAIESVLASIMHNVIVVNGFDNGALTYDPLLPMFSDLHTMDYLHGYWIKVNESTTLSFNGTIPSSKTLSMGTGWNLVSYMCDSEKSTTSVFGSIMDKVIVINGFDNGALTYDPALPMFSDLLVIKPNHGYWLKLSQPATLDYGAVC